MKKKEKTAVESVKKEQGNHNFVHGAMILTAGMIVVKLVGALFKIPLESVIGAYGMGLFNVSYNFYGPIHSLASAGLPIAISRMVSQQYSKGRFRDVQRIKKVSSPIFIGLGIFGTVLMIVASPFYCRHIIDNENALLPMLMLAPAILFGCLSSIYRGYCEGLKNMYPTAISEIIEAVSKFAFGLSAAVALTIHLGNEYKVSQTIFGKFIPSADEAALVTLSFAVTGAIAGVTLGTLLSFLYLSIRFKVKGDGITKEMLKSSPLPYSKRSVAKKLVMSALPIGIGAIASNLAGLVDTTFLQSRIGDVMSEKPDVILNMFKGMIPDSYVRYPGTIPNFLFGCYTMALAVYMLVPTITQAFSTSALPNVTAVWTQGNRKKIKQSLESVIRITAMFALPAGIGISALAPHITALLYGDSQSAQITSNLLLMMGFASCAAAISTPVSSLLQAVGRMDLPVKALLASMAIKVGINYYLCGIPEINVYGAGIGTLVCYIFLAVIQVVLLMKVTKIKLSIKNIIGKPLVSGIFCGIAAHTASNIAVSISGQNGRLGGLVGSAAGIAFAAAIYVVFMLLLKGINKNDVLMLPKGEKIAKLLEKRMSM